MAVMVTANRPGMTQDMYDTMASELLPLLRQREGFIAHVAWAVDDGFKIVQIWESESQRTAWNEQVVRAKSPEGLPAAEVSVHPVRDALIADTAPVGR
jgi:heme-degrading monooxygenase HmoA